MTGGEVPLKSNIKAAAGQNTSLSWMLFTALPTQESFTEKKLTICQIENYWFSGYVRRLSNLINLTTSSLISECIFNIIIIFSIFSGYRSGDGLIQEQVTEPLGEIDCETHW